MADLTVTTTLVNGDVFDPQVVSDMIGAKVAAKAAMSGYIKVDSTGAPYPNSREFFLQNHTHIEGDWYFQHSPVLKAWCRREKMCPEVEWLIGSGRLRIDENDPERYFNAVLWSAELHAAKDAVIIFNHRETPEDLASIGFRFITREEFDLTYRIVG